MGDGDGDGDGHYNRTAIMVLHDLALNIRTRHDGAKTRFTLAATLTTAALMWHAASTTAAGPALTFTDVTKSAGLSFVHTNGAAGGYWYPELFGGGVAVLDVDGDRWPDLLFLSGRNWKAEAGRARNELYRNNRNGTFSNITTGSGFDTLDAYALGATVGDFDNDGRDDVFVTTTEGGRLFRNAGNNTFLDVSARAGIHPGAFAVSAAWFDYDKDGLLDLFVGNYVQWTPMAEGQVRCTQGGERGYCGPDAYKPVAPTLYHNLGGGRFEDATASAGLSDPSDKVMGVAVLDYNGDGWPDLFVGSDRVPAKLYRNDGKRHFVDEAVRDQQCPRCRASAEHHPPRVESLQCNRHEQRADQITGGIQRVHRAGGQVAPAQIAAHRRQKQTIGKSRQPERDGRRQRQRRCDEKDRKAAVFSARAGRHVRQGSMHTDGASPRVLHTFVRRACA